MKTRYNLIAIALVLIATYTFTTSARAISPTAYQSGYPYNGTGFTPDTVLWYNGDFDGRNGGAEQDGGQLGVGQFSHIYDNFTGPGMNQSWNVTSVFSNDLFQTGLVGNVTSAYWEVRTGVSAGNGGTLLASGTSPATVTATGRSGFGLNEYMVQANGLSLLLPHLNSGFYFLTVSPIVPQGINGQSFQSTTSGANCVGTPCGNDDNSFWNSNLFGQNYSSTTALFGAGTWDLSGGVIGTVVPEPATVALLTCGLGALVVAIRRRRA